MIETVERIIANTGVPAAILALMMFGIWRIAQTLMPWFKECGERQVKLIENQTSILEEIKDLLTETYHPSKTNRALLYLADVLVNGIADHRPEEARYHLEKIRGILNGDVES